MWLAGSIKDKEESECEAKRIVKLRDAAVACVPTSSYTSSLTTGPTGPSENFDMCSKQLRYGELTPNSCLRKLQQRIKLAALGSTVSRV